MSDTISVALRDWCAANLGSNGDEFVFADGARFDDVRAAIQAAWLADAQPLALELARQYNIDNILCLRCVRACSAATRICDMCHLEVLAGRLDRVRRHA